MNYIQEGWVQSLSRGRKGKSKGRREQRIDGEERAHVDPPDLLYRANTNEELLVLHPSVENSLVL